MGISINCVKLFLREASRKPFQGRALMLGKQDVLCTYDELVNAAREFGAELGSTVSPQLSGKPDFAARGWITDTCLFKSLGFSACDSLDCSDFEKADHVYDLNRNGVPEKLVQRYDLIFDGGTIEHVFHLPNVLNNLFLMLRLQGRVIHVAPSSNYIDHGLYMFSPTFFWDFYCANDYAINNMQVFRHGIKPGPWEISNYVPGCLDRVKNCGGLDDGMYAIVCIATKKETSTGHMIPLQGTYLRDWESAKAGQDTGNAHIDPYRQLVNSSNQQVTASQLLPVADSCSGAVEAIINSASRPERPALRITTGLRRLMQLFRVRRPFDGAAALSGGESQLPKINQTTTGKGLGLEIIARY